MPASLPALTLDRMTDAPRPALRLAEPSEAGAVKQLIDAAFGHYVARIGRPPAPMTLDIPVEIGAGHVWVAVDPDGGVCGALVMYATADGWYVDTVAVHPSAQGQGLGRMLMVGAEHVCAERGLPAVHLCTNLLMTENQRLYPHLGYIETGRRHEAGHDRVYYRKAVHPEAAL